MKNSYSIAVSILLAAISSSALAHEPSMHTKESATRPDCSQMKDMDPSKIDMNDPLMQALYDQCKDSATHDDMGGHNMESMPGMDGTSAQPADSEGK